MKPNQAKSRQPTAGTAAITKAAPRRGRTRSSFGSSFGSGFTGGFMDWAGHSDPTFQVMSRGGFAADRAALAGDFRRVGACIQKAIDDELADAEA